MSDARAVRGLGWPGPVPDGDHGRDLGWPAGPVGAPALPAATADGVGSSAPGARHRESLVREALAQAMTDTSERDVSRETFAAPPADHVSRETVAEADQETPIAAAAAAALRVGSGEPFPAPLEPRLLTVANQKGGVGKTTTTVNLAAALALRGLRVLVIDLDPQGNTSTALGVAHQAGVPSIYDTLIDDVPLADVVAATNIPGLGCVPATIDLAGAEIELVSVVARESRLKKAIAAYDAPLDYLLIDCPPSLGLLTVNAMVAARELLIPIQCEYYALEGLGQLLRNVDLIRTHLNPELAVTTILLTMYDGRTRLADQVAAEVRSHFGELVLGATIPRSVRISEAPGYGQSVLTYDPASRGAQAYLEAARELAVRGARPADRA